MADAGREIRVVAADDSYLSRVALAGVLGSAEGVRLVAVCGDRDELLAAVDEHRPDVVVTDIRMPPDHDDEGLQVAAALRAGHASVAVVILSAYDDLRYALALLDGGSAGRAYLRKAGVNTGAELVDAIRAVADGGSVIDAEIIEQLIHARSGHGPRGMSELTPRQIDVLALVARGLSNQAIADRLVLTKRAVEKHVAAVFSTLGLNYDANVSRRVKAALIYLHEQDAWRHEDGAVAGGENERFQSPRFGRDGLAGQVRSRP